MNIFKKIGFAASIIVTAVMSSCSDKGYWDAAPLEPAYSFQNTSYSATIAPGANEFELTLVRTMSDADESVNITFTPGENCPSDITVESPAVFKAGSFTTEVKIKIANATPPFTYSGTVGFDGKVSYSGNASCTISLPVSYTWSSIGTGTFLDTWVMEGADPYSVEIMKADGFERYRVMNPYKEFYASELGQVSWENWIASSGPEYVEFWENEDGTLSFNAYATGLNYQAKKGQPIGAYPWNAFSSGTVAGFDIWYATGFAVLSPMYYIDGVGGFGQQQYAVQIELPK